MLKYTAILVAILGVGVTILSCADETVKSSQSRPSVRVTGEVLAWYCGVRDGWNPTPEPRYTVATGEPALVKFIRTDGLTVEVKTDESSSLNASIEKGSYMLVLQIGHAYPDTLPSVTITGDTTIELNAVYDFLASDTIDLSFYYRSTADSLGEAEEYMWLERLANEMEPSLVLSNALRRVDSNQWVSWVVVHYRVPLAPDFLAWEVCEQAKTTVSQLGDFPDNFHIRLDSYICLR